MNEILPPGSTSDDLQAAIDRVASGDTIIISGDMPFTDIVTVPAGKEITVQSDTGNNWTLSQATFHNRHFNVKGGLVLQDVTLDGANTGGGVNVNPGTITVNSGTVIKNCYAPEGGGVYADGEFIMNGGSIQRNKADGNGGGVYISVGNGIMSGGSISNNTALQGGGVFGGPFTLSGGEISGNSVSEVGGGIYVGTVFNITGGSLKNNTAEYYAGGVYGHGIVNMTGGEITGNRAASTYYIGIGGGGVVDMYRFYMTGGTLSGNIAVNGNGGAVYAITGAEFSVSDGVITGNESVNGNGGAVFLQQGSSINVFPSGYFTNNKALNGDGGAIYTEDTTYANIITAGDTVFSCNRAAAAYPPPENAAELYPDMRFASTTVMEHPLNNFDVNYTEGEPVTVTYNVIYDANGGAGSYTGPDIEPGGTDTVLSPAQTGISREGYAFTGWNIEPDGSGAEYAPGDSIVLNCNATLYARWAADERFTVTYGANGGAGGYTDSGRQFGTNYTILSPVQAGISRPGFTFTGWNTRPDGRGMSFAPGDVITITGDVGLYAQWRQNPAPKPKRMCPNPVTKCRTSVEGQKIWMDNDNIGNKRPDSVEILLLRDGEVYRRTLVNSGNDWAFGFCCLPVWKNSTHKYSYRIDEVVPDGYTKTIDGYNVINTLNP